MRFPRKQRREKLFAAGVISREEMERDTREYNVAKAQYQEAVERHSLVDDHAREEDVALAQSELAIGTGAGGRRAGKIREDSDQVSH